VKKLKDLLKESYVWERKFGESLPTLKDCEEKYAKKEITESVESQVKGLFKDTILPAFSEDFTFSDKKHADKALKTLKKLVSQLKVNDFVVTEGVITEAAKHGFDLTDFKRNGFKQLLKALKIKPKAQLVKNESGWGWKGNGILIVTGNNPLTGEYASAAVKRKNEKDYASYIGIEGKPELVKQAVELVHKWASYIKNESPGRRNYI